MAETLEIRAGGTFTPPSVIGVSSPDIPCIRVRARMKLGEKTGTRNIFLPRKQQTRTQHSGKSQERRRYFCSNNFCST
jgi:hypothetical protein